MRWITTLIVLSIAGVAYATPPITAVAFSPDGKHVVAVSQSGLCTYDWPSLSLKDPIRLPVPHPTDLYFHPEEGRLVVTGGVPSEWGRLTVTNWPIDQKNNAKLCTLDGDVWFASTPIDEGYVVASANGELLGVDQGGKVIRNYKGHSRHVLCLERSGTMLFSGGDDTSIRVWNINSGERLRTLNHHTGAVRDLAVRPGDQGPLTLASAGADKTIRLWQPAIGRLVRFARLESAPLTISWTPGGDLLLAACEDGCLRVIDPHTVKITQTMKAIDGWAYAVAASPDGKHAVIAGEGGQLKTVAIKRNPAD